MVEFKALSRKMEGPCVCGKCGIFLYSNSSAAGIAQLVERHLAKVNVAGSNPVSRSVLEDACCLADAPRDVSGSKSISSPSYDYRTGFCLWRRTQVVRERSAKPLCGGSSPPGASKQVKGKKQKVKARRLVTELVRHCSLGVAEFDS